jgi:hypothetical protein
METDIIPKSGSKTHMTIRYDYNNVQKPTM